MPQSSPWSGKSCSCKRCVLNRGMRMLSFAGIQWVQCNIHEAVVGWGGFLPTATRKFSNINLYCLPLLPATPRDFWKVSAGVARQQQNCSSFSWGLARIGSTGIVGNVTYFPLLTNSYIWPSGSFSIMLPWPPVSDAYRSRELPEERGTAGKKWHTWADCACRVQHDVFKLLFLV